MERSAAAGKARPLSISSDDDQPRVPEWDGGDKQIDPLSRLAISLSRLQRPKMGHCGPFSGSRSAKFSSFFPLLSAFPDKRSFLASIMHFNFHHKC
jgi:hypothetical protein